MNIGDRVMAARSNSLTMTIRDQLTSVTPAMWLCEPDSGGSSRWFREDDLLPMSGAVNQPPTPTAQQEIDALSAKVDALGTTVTAVQGEVATVQASMATPTPVVTSPPTPAPASTVSGGTS